MPVFANFSDLLPDPVFKINTAGATFSDASNVTLVTDGVAGPGFAKIKFASNNQTQVSRTISGRGVTASPSYHNWSFDISYNPMTRDEFEPVSTFLESRNGRLKPFYVILPQHSRPKDTAFYNFIGSTTQVGVIRTLNSENAGTSTINIIGRNISQGQETSTAIVGTPSPGDFFIIKDTADANHKKAYKVVRVETPATYQVGSPTINTGRMRIHIVPPLARNVTLGSELVFVNPMFRVIQKGDTLEYDLDTDNLYQFSLSLEEIQP
jgi:hypothetical protein